MLPEICDRVAKAVCHELHAFDDYQANESFAVIVKTLRKSDVTRPLAEAIVAEYGIAYSDSLLAD